MLENLYQKFWIDTIDKLHFVGNICLIVSEQINLPVIN